MTKRMGPLRIGERVEHRFAVDKAAMAAFQSLSNDRSRIHTDDAYARSRGNRGVIAYGGIMLAQLSHVLGSAIPGDHGVSTKWEITYRSPLYLDEPALLTLEVVNVSKAVGHVEGKFKIEAGERLIATGKTQSIVPSDEIADE